MQKKGKRDARKERERETREDRRRGEDRAGCSRYRRRRLRPSRRPSGADQRRRGEVDTQRDATDRYLDDILLLSRDDDDDDDDVNDSADEEEEKWSDLLEQFD